MTLRAVRDSGRCPTHVLLRGDGFEVCRIHAAPVLANAAGAVGVKGVADVVDLETVRYRTHEQQVGRDVRGHVRPVVVNFPADSPVAVAIDMSCPQPAAFGLVDVEHEPSFIISPDAATFGVAVPAPARVVVHAPTVRPGLVRTAAYRAFPHAGNTTTGQLSRIPNWAASDDNSDVAAAAAGLSIDSSLAAWLAR